MPKIVGVDQDAVKRITCKNCASIIEYTNSECHDINHSYDWTGDYEVSRGFKCPKCNKNVFPGRR